MNAFYLRITRIYTVTFQTVVDAAEDHRKKGEKCPIKIRTFAPVSQLSPVRRDDAPFVLFTRDDEPGAALTFRKYLRRNTRFLDLFRTEDNLNELLQKHDRHDFMDRLCPVCKYEAIEPSCCIFVQHLSLTPSNPREK